MTPTGCRMYPRYSVIRFRLRRHQRMNPPQTVNPQRVELHQQVITLRSEGMSYPAIADQLRISVGTAWNYANSPPTLEMMIL